MHNKISMSVTQPDKFDQLVKNLDLVEHTSSLKSFFSRQQPLYINGDQQRHFEFIQSLQNIEFKAPPKIDDFSPFLLHLKKHGVLNFTQIFEIVKLVRYIRYFKKLKSSGIVHSWIDSVNIPDEFQDIERYFDEKGNFNEDLDERLYGLNQRIKSHKNQINSTLKRLLHSSKLNPYLIDMQIHLVQDEECLLVRGGFNHVLKGSVVARSSGGYFYVYADATLKEKEAIRHINQERVTLLYDYTKEFCEKLHGMVLFLNYINKEFNRFDHYQARIHFAKSKDFVIMHSQKHTNIKIVDFKHPALKNAKSVSVDFSKNVLMITGVNAGGKTMLLKSLLSSVLMAKYLIPMHINESQSSIGSFKHIGAIIDDPQNTKNDISTFAGRMKAFANIFSFKSALVGIDEIELGTDSDEAAALFKVLLDELIKKQQKIIVTTHHKRLASLMADRDDVELLAALYDEARRVPTYDFLQGVIGKSYAFETASRYGIAGYIVSQAKQVYGQNHEKLNELIERGSTLERELRQKHKQLDEKMIDVDKKQQYLKELEIKLFDELRDEKQKLRAEFDKAINEAKKAVTAIDNPSKHRAMNKANKALPKENIVPKKPQFKFKVGDFVKYHNQKGVIDAIKANDATVLIDGMRLKVKIYDLKPSGKTAQKKQKIDIKIDIEQKSGALKCDLHGLHVEEALEVLDKFISDALMQGWDEVIVYHGIGEGILSAVVKEYLEHHPKIVRFEDAPQHMGGYGAKLVYL